MAEEIELKLALPEDAQRLMLRHRLLKQAVGRHGARLINLYYDTPDLALRRRGIALRLRAHGRRWLQTVKCAGRAAGGLSSRPEWEIPYAGHFDFSAIDDHAVRAWLEKQERKGRLAPVFETNFQRIAWEFAPAPGTEIELVLDRGWIAAAGRREGISEVEIELKQGDATQLFRLARALAGQLPLAPAPLSKADRGYGLFVPVLAAPVRAAAIPLAPDDIPEHAFARIALGCLDHLQRNHAGALASDDPEYIHQMRVALRRLRAALRLFGPLLPSDLAATLVPPLRELMQVLGNARDLDVLLAEIVEPVVRALPDEPRLAALAGIITARRFEHRRAALEFLRAPRYGTLVLAVLEALHARSATIPDEPQTLAAFAALRLQRLRKQVRRRAAAAESGGPLALHALRIAIKRLRYALEFFAPLAAPRALRRVLDTLAGLQDTLGQINDLANAGALLTECAGGDARLREAVTLIGGWHGPRYQKLLAAAARERRRLGRLQLPRLAA